MRRILLVGTFWLVLLTACDAASQPVPTVLQEPTLTPQPTATRTPIPTPTSTRTPIPTSVPTRTPEPTQHPASTPAPAVKLGKAQSIKAGGFSFQPPDEANIELYADFATTYDKATGVTIFLGNVIHEQPETLEVAIKKFIGGLAPNLVDPHMSEPYAITVDNAPGLGADFTGVWRGDKGAGQVAVVAIDEVRYLLVFGFAPDGADEKVWENKGRPTLQAVLDSVRFFEPVSGTCAVATDPTYGYTRENPIRVGENPLTSPIQEIPMTSLLRGPSRERAYLDALRGPKGEPITYKRSGSLAGKGVILDAYEITWSGLDQPIVLYLDMYHYVEPKAPVGLTCAYPFPLSEP